MLKRIFDFVFALSALLLTGWLIVILYVLASIDTRQSGMFWQWRVGREAKMFKIYKIRTITFTKGGYKKISNLGSILRHYKLDELPQFYNILIGNMSVVGPRPDISGYYDVLEGDERALLKLRPGLTGPANLKYWNEEQLLAIQTDPDEYNDNVLFPDKVAINMVYLKNQSFMLDLKIIVYTLFKKKFRNDYFK